MNEAQRLAYIQSTREKIAKYGHVVQAVGTEPYAYAYTIGLTPTLGFELITMGLPIPTAQMLLNDVAALVMEGKHEDGVDLPLTTFNLPMRLREYDVLMGSRIKLLNVARAVGIFPSTLRQVVWPDPKGRFPGDAQYDFPCAQDLDEIARTMG